MAKIKMTPYSIDDDIDDIPNNILDLDDEAGDISGNVLSLDDDTPPKKPTAAPTTPSKPKAIISSEPPKTGLPVKRTPTVSPEALDRLPSKVHDRNNIIARGTRASKVSPGKVGGVMIGSKAKSKVITKSYPSPLPFMYDTNELNKLRPLPIGKRPILSGGVASAAISAAPGSSPAAVAATAATTPAGASIAVKNFIKNKAASVSGSSVIKKFSTRKSMAVGGLAAVGLATSIATSKNRLNDKERR